MLKNLLKYIFYIWITVLVIRSFVYSFRTYQEFKNPPAKVSDKINICSAAPVYHNYIEERLNFYLEIGGKCER